MPYAIPTKFRNSHLTERMGKTDKSGGSNESTQHKLRLQSKLIVSGDMDLTFMSSHIVPSSPTLFFFSCSGCYLNWVLWLCCHQASWDIYMSMCSNSEWAIILWFSFFPSSSIANISPHTFQFRSSCISLEKQNCWSLVWYNPSFPELA